MSSHQKQQQQQQQADENDTMVKTYNWVVTTIRELLFTANFVPEGAVRDYIIEARVALDGLAPCVKLVFSQRVSTPTREFVAAKLNSGRIAVATFSPSQPREMDVFIPFP